MLRDMRFGPSGGVSGKRQINAAIPYRTSGVRQVRLHANVGHILSFPSLSVCICKMRMLINNGA